MGVTAFVVVALLAGQSSAYAWSQLVNKYPNNPVSCDNSPGNPCIAWPIPGGLSANVGTFLYSSLATGNIDITGDVRNAIGNSNGQPYKNPLLNIRATCSDTFPCPVTYELGTIPGDPYSWASTSVFYSGNTVTGGRVIFRSNVTWNQACSFDVNIADSRKVTMHETGHVNALGHTGIAGQVMMQGAVCVWTFQWNDQQGLNAIYGPS